eukprot:COSAG01_NODE_9481_length_2435_cov_2.250856_2_plen_183_part_00
MAGVCRSRNAQCLAPYTTLTDAYRATSTGSGHHYDCAGATGPGGRYVGTGVGGGGWYRFSGAGGDALPLQPPGPNQCGTDYTGWLTGWDGGGGAGTGCTSPGNAVYTTTGPPCGYSTPGRYPAAAEGVAEMTACFDESGTSGGEECVYHAAVGVVMCDGFLLWRLPYAPRCHGAYCMAASGL